MRNLSRIAILATLNALVPALAAESSGILDRIKADKAITVAYSGDSLPFAYTESNGEAMGYTIDLCKRVIAQVGRAIGVPNLKVNWVAAGTAQRLEMVAG